MIYKMYELNLEKSKFYRVKRGQTASEIEKTLCIPVNGKVFKGMIIEVPQTPFIVYKADVGDSYFSIAQKFGVDETELKTLNGNRPVYPTCRIFISK